MTTVEQAAEPAATPARRTPWWRRVLVVILVVIGCFLAPISVLGIWARTTVLETEGYVDTVAPLADDPAIQEALATRVTEALFRRLDVQAEVKDALPARAAFVAPFVADGLEGFVHDRTLDFVESERFHDLWEQANRRAHARVLAVLEGEGTETIETKNGQVVLDLAPVVDRVKAQLDDRGIDIFDDVELRRSGKFVLFESEGLTSAQSGVRLLDKVTFVLPVFSVLLLAAGIALSSNRRRTLLWAALGVAFAMAIILVTFNLARGVYLDALVNAGRSRDASAAVYDQVLDALRISLRATFVLGLVVAIGAWLAGPGRVATRLRVGTVGLVRGSGTGETTDVARFVHEHRVPLRIAVVGLGVLVLVVRSHPGPFAVVVVGILVVIGLLLLEFLGRSASARSG